MCEDCSDLIIPEEGVTPISSVRVKDNKEFHDYE